MKKYELLKEDYLESKGERVFRIKALKDFSYIKKGTLGGYIASEKNLSQEGNAWVEDRAIVCGKAVVGGNAVVSDSAVIGGNAVISDYGKIYGSAVVYGNAKVACCAMVNRKATVKGNSVITDNAYITGETEVIDSQIGGEAIIVGKAKIVNETIFPETRMARANLTTPVVQDLEEWQVH